jgi:hypothetical protein
MPTAYDLKKGQFLPVNPPVELASVISGSIGAPTLEISARF